LGAYEAATPYFPRALLSQSLQHIAPTWLHEQRWGQQREELIAPYAQWLHHHGVLADADAWRGATSNRYLLEPQA